MLSRADSGDLQEDFFDTTKCDKLYLDAYRDERNPEPVFRSTLRNSGYTWYSTSGYALYSTGSGLILGSSTPIPKSGLSPDYQYREKVSDQKAQEKINNKLQPLLEKQKLSDQWFAFLAGGVGANRKQHLHDTRYSSVDKLLNTPISDPQAILLIRKFL